MTLPLQKVPPLPNSWIEKLKAGCAMRRVATPSAALLLCFAVSAAVTWSVRAREDVVVEGRFEAATGVAQGRIVSLLESDLALLRAGAVIVAARGHIDQQLFQSYVARAGLLNSHEWIESVGFVAPDGRESTGDAAGPCEEPACRGAMDAARVTGELRISGPLGGHRFAAVAPVYGASGEQRALVGFVYGVFRADELVERVMPVPTAVLHLEDGGQVLHEGKGPLDVPRRSSIRTLTVPGRTWTLRADALAGFDRASRSRSDILVGSASFALSLMVFALAALRARARAQAEGMQARLILSDRLVALGGLAAGVAHEINNPLSFVAANLAFALDRLRQGGSGARGEVPGEVQTALEEASDGARRIATIVGDLKMVTRNREGDADTAVELRPIIEAVLNIAHHDVESRARVETDFGDAPTVRGSAGRLGQLFLNLVVNAAQAMPEARAENRIRISTRKTPDGDAVIEVADTGCGIPQAVRHRIFEPFFTTKPVGVGTGLGLSICHGIVTRLGGRIEVESEVGRGSVFRVVLPAL